MNQFIPNYISNPYSNTQRYSTLQTNYYSRYPNELTNNFNQNNTLVNSMLNTRLSKLNYEKDVLNEIQNRNPYYPPTPYTYNKYSPPLNYSNLANFGQNIMQPPSSHYLVDFTIPIPHPLEFPKMCSPVSPPRYDTGGPLQGKHCCHKNNALDILLLLTQIGKIPPREKTPKKESKTTTPKKKKKKIGGKKKIVEKKVEHKIPEVKKKIQPKRTIGRDWWKLCRNFVNLYLFWGTAYKYSIFYKKMRENAIEERTKSIVQEISILKDWLIAIEEPFWNEFKIFDDLNVSFKNSDAKNKIKKQSQKIIAIIKKFMENLISRSSKLSDIPTKVQKILYEFIKNRAYFPKKYLSTYQINRIDFEFYGGGRLITVPQGAMIISYLLICGIIVQQVLLHMKDVFIEFTKFPYIDISGKYIGSIMHYLTRDTFMYDPGLIQDILALFNFYRNYHVYNEQIEKQHDIFSGQLMLQDTENEDEYAEYLIDENDISEFWNLNPKFVETYKSFIYAWSCKLAKAIKLKYEKEFPNPLPRKKLERPPVKAVEKPEDLKDDSDDDF